MTQEAPGMEGAVGTWKPEDPRCADSVEGKSLRGRQRCSRGRSSYTKVGPGRLMGVDDRQGVLESNQH